MGHFVAAVTVTLLPIPEGVTVTADHCSNVHSSLEREIGSQRWGGTEGGRKRVRGMKYDPGT